MRVPNELLQEVIDNNGETRCGPVNSMGALRLALDLKEARKALKSNIPQAQAKELLNCVKDVLNADGDLNSMDFQRYRKIIKEIKRSK